MNKAYSLIEIKSVDEGSRTIKGVATTPSPDRMGDVITTEGIVFKLPLPLLYQHDSRNPIGTVTDAKATKKGITVEAKVAPMGMDADVDKAWSKIKNGLVRGLSIGFRTLEESFDHERGGFNILRSEWLELSAVTIPANADATITSVKAFDLNPAASGTEGFVDQWKRTLQLEGVSSKPKGKTMTIAEQLTQWDTKLVSTKEQADAIMTKAADAAAVLTDEEETKHDELMAEVAKITKHIDRLKVHEKTLLTKAVPVPQEVPLTEKQAIQSRSNIISVKKLDPPGVGLARIALAHANGHITMRSPVEVAMKRWPDNPEIAMQIKATIEAGDTTTSGWASQLVPSATQFEDGFLSLLRAQTIIDRIPGLRRVPFNVAIPVETASGTVQWVGEGAPKPATKLTLTSVTLRWEKAAAIVGITEELARFSRPDAEVLVRDSMIQTMVRFFDTYFIGAAAAVTNVAPAGILNGISATASTAATAAAFRTDMNNLLNNFTANNVSLANIVLIMSSTQAIALSLMVTDLGVSLFSSITREGGTILGFPVIISEAVGTKIIAIDSSSIFLAEDPGVQVAVSREASIEMSDTPIVGDASPFTSAVLKSAFQNNLIFIRFEQYKTWKVGRTSAVEWLSPAVYVP